MGKELVSIITPMYNGAKYIEETIKSVLAQTYTNWEMIVVNDGSKDNGPEIVKQYTEKDSRIQLVNQSNAGSAAARNNGIRRAKGRYIALLDSDDLWDKCFIEKQLQLLNDTKGLLAYSSYRRINEKSQEILSPVKVKPVLTFKQMQKTNYIGCLTGLYDTSVFGKVYLKEELKSIRDDYAYWLDIISMTKVAYGNENILASYRVMSNSTTGNKKKLIKPQFLFYYNYQKLGLVRSVLYTFYWAFLGWKKFNN